MNFGDLIEIDLSTKSLCYMYDCLCLILNYCAFCSLSCTHTCPSRHTSAYTYVCVYGKVCFLNENYSSYTLKAY